MAVNINGTGSITGLSSISSPGISGVPVGSASAPAFSFTGDTNTGIYSPGANQVAVATNGVGRLFVDASGHVGINTSAPTNSFTSTIFKSNSGSAPVHIYNDTAYWGLFDNGGTTGGYAPGNGFAGHATNNFLNLFTAGSERLRITSAGLVGVGTSSVTHALTVTTAGTDAVKINTADYGYLDLSNGTSTVRLQNVANVPRIGTATNHPLVFAVNEIVGMRLTSTGLGVGTTSPNQPLHVNGIIQADSSGNYLQLQQATNDSFINNTGSGGIIFRQGAGFTERARIDSSGRLGIGTSSPSVELSIAGSDPQLVLWEGSDGASSSKVQLGTGLVQGFINIHKGDGTRTVQISSDDTSYFNGGNVGIGTTSPSVILETNVASGSNEFRQSVAGVTRGQLIASATDQTFANSGTGSQVFYNTGSERARIDSSGRLLVGTSSSLESNSLIQSYKPSGSVYFLTRSDSLANGESAELKAVSGGRTASFGIYKHAGITNPGSYMYLQKEDGGPSYIWVGNDNNVRTSTTDTNIGTNNGTVVGSQTSDERVKNILGPVEYGLDTIKQIEPVRYAMKSEPDAEKLGFIAQQVQPLIPQSIFDTKEHVEGEPEDAPTKLGMEYVALIPVLVNAIKELSAEVDALKAQLS